MWMPFLPPCTSFEDLTMPRQWWDWAFGTQVGTCFKEEMQFELSHNYILKLTNLKAQIKYLSNCLFGVWIHDLMSFSYPILTVATPGATSSEYDVHWTASVTGSTFFRLTWILGCLCLGGVVSLDGWWNVYVLVDTPPSSRDVPGFLHYNTSKRHRLWPKQKDFMSQTKKTWKVHTYTRIQSGCNLLLQHLHSFFLFQVVDGHLLLNKFGHEICLSVALDFNRKWSWTSKRP